MAALKQYFETDFNNTTRVHVKLEGLPESIEAALLYDFSAFTVFLTLYVPEKDHDLDSLIEIFSKIKYGETRMNLDGKVTLPKVRHFPGAIQVKNENPFEISAQFFGDPGWISSNTLQASRRIFLYSESNLNEHEVLKLKGHANSHGHDLQFRSLNYEEKRTTMESPLAFISHDSRDKEAVARRIAITLRGMLCPTWYDEFSLIVGANLRASIEKGLKECKKCILILSPNFLSNNGWTKKEFDSIFTREIIEESNLVLPVWYGVTKKEVYDYSPSLLNIKGISWDELGEEEVCRQLNRAITE